ncbi:damage-inducible protein DinB [Niastella caeni]|uniref:Damage-inducible protein DinB n=1 Tax=Niastella caeni TaxID=2569763 RepID=A0A4S8I1A9_9BACT|nr:DinB family protein [Niastella caeni]THU40979.1 damage-inducible protein DinB [Niastella caeni]
MATDIIDPPTTSPITYLMKNYANYNLWANTTLISWLKTKPAASLEKEMPSSFAGIKLTLLHIWQTERYWLSILKKEKPVTQSEFNGSVYDVFDVLLKTSGELADYINKMTDENVQDKTLIESQWFRCNFRNFEYIMHYANHSTYHRGQVVTIGRNLGFTDAPMTDYNFYNIDGKEY